MRLYLCVKLKYESNTIILFDGIRYSVRDLLSNLNNYALEADGKRIFFFFGRKIKKVPKKQFHFRAEK